MATRGPPILWGKPHLPPRLAAVARVLGRHDLARKHDFDDRMKFFAYTTEKYPRTRLAPTTLTAAEQQAVL